MDNERGLVWIVVITYSFDSEVQLHSFLGLEEAMSFVKESLAEEKRIDEEENEWCVDEAHDPDYYYASLTVHFYDHDDITEWHIIQERIGENGLFI